MEEILPDNIPDEIPNSTNIEDYVGKIICVDINDAKERVRSRKMRRVNIE